MKKMNKWDVETDKKTLRRLGKLIEELAELTNVAGRCIIQGIDSVDPSSQKANRLRLEEEVADVLTQVTLIKDHFKLDESFISNRVSKKTEQMAQWESYFKDEDK